MILCSRRHLDPRRGRFASSRAVLLLVSLPGLPAAPQGAALNPLQEDALAQFETEVRPILAEHCVECHGGKKPKGGLRLDSSAGIRSGALGEPIAVPHDPEASPIVEAVLYDDPFYAMPPDGKLPAKDIEAITRWVELGAVVPEEFSLSESDLVGWSQKPPVALEAALLESARESGFDWIDAAIQNRLEEAGVEPSDPAAGVDWLRRVTFDLTGLPPTPAEWAAFTGAEDTQALREAVVDRLLASTAFGERWARRWLDLVRYAETRAHEFDFPIPNAYQYRDYVIRAFVADVPYDRFVTELLAGDLVGSARLDPGGEFDESVLGTGAWFLGEEVHSPVEPRGDQADRIAHQVEVLSKSVLAMGVACARCHDHKFDPISAEDYHAFGGFALSTAARQVRFETDGHNQSVAQELRQVTDTLQESARRAVAEALRLESASLAEGLSLWREQDVLAAVATPIDEDQREALDAQFLDAELALPDLLLEDFEAPSLEAAALGPWRVEGEAFLERPVVEADVQRSQSFLGQRGNGSVNSYAGHPEAQDFSADRLTGRITSAPFRLSRRYLHLLINGGDHGETRFEVIGADDGAVLASVSGFRSNALRPVVMDLRPYRGALVRARFVDESTEEWGQIGGDHLVLSDDGHASALQDARSAGGWSRVIQATGSDAGKAMSVMHWVSLLERTGREPGVLRGWDHPMAWLALAWPSPWGEPRTVVDYGGLSDHRWIPNGPAFGPGPVGAGTVTLDVIPGAELPGGGGSELAVSVSARAGAMAHPMWRDLEVRTGAETDRGGDFDWNQAGRTLLSPTFECETGRLAHLVRGKADALLVIAGHKMISGPLHQGCVLHIDTGGEWTWVEHDVPTGEGLRAHLEFTASGTGAFEVARTVELHPKARVPEATFDTRWMVERLGELGSLEPPFGASDPLLESLIQDAASLLEDGAIEGRWLSDGEREGLLELADYLARRHAGVRQRLETSLAPAAAVIADVRSKRRLLSALAPAAIDLEGIDERILDRGSWRSPGKRAPRRAPEALRVAHGPEHHGPLATDGEGSGRLAFAEALLQSPTKRVQRVWVNRVWAAIFGEGLVATVDDFGAMGAAPTYPRILDQLCLDFERDGWSTKALVKRLVLTEAYGRMTRPTPSALAQDPEGKLLAHARVRRLEAEELRDALMSVSGELKEEAFGPSIPLHLTSFMAGRGRPSESGPLDGAGRRSIYLAVRRNFPHPLLSAFDQPVPSTCHGRRSSSNVPAQALALLNDPFVEQQARAFGERAKSASRNAAIRSMWIRALGREPDAEEESIAQAYLEGGGDDGWTDLGHVLFNLKDFLFLHSPRRGPLPAGGHAR